MGYKGVVGLLRFFPLQRDHAHYRLLERANIGFFFSVENSTHMWLMIDSEGFEHYLPFLILTIVIL